MDLSLERDNSALGSLFQQIINDMKNTSPLWEDFVAKAGKLHACLRAAIQAIAGYLDSFQKIADAATNSRGASKEIGTALTRVCLRHKAVETRLKTFTAAIMDCLVQPLQEKLEEWKRTVVTIDKEHAKQYKRCRTELKKRSSDTIRLQKKARKGQTDTIQSLMDTHMQDVTLRRAELEEVEKKSLRSAMIEERIRYCTFVHMLQPVVKEECEVMSELGHLQEAMQSIAIVTKEPSVLPQASEELIHDAKASISLCPESPTGGSGSQGGCSNSLGSRKSSVCSISSINSSGSSNSPGYHHYPRSLSQLISPAIRLKPGESSDSGFCSSPALTTQTSTATSQSHAISTWPPHSQEVVTIPPTVDRPHTISTAYEKCHQRPPLTVYTFQNSETLIEAATNGSGSGQNTPCTQKSPAGPLNRPPLPVRCSSLERPLSANNNRNGGSLLQRQCPSPIPAHITKELSIHHAQQQPLQLQSPPTYVNMSELANMAAFKMTNQQQHQLQQAQVEKQQKPLFQQQHSIDSISSETTAGSSLQQHHHTNTRAPRSHSISSSASSNTPSLHSHPSIESTVPTPIVGHTPSPSSGSSTPQNHYSPLLTNSPSSTAAGTPSGANITSGVMGVGFTYNVCSPTPPQSAVPFTATDVRKEVDGVGSSPFNSHTPSSKDPNTTTTATHEAATTVQMNEQSSNYVAGTDSPTIVENDYRSRASVLQKASMFEKQAAAAAAITTPPIPRAATVDSGSIYGTRLVEENRATPTHNMQPQTQQQQQQTLEQNVVGSVTRIARRSSVNTAKPPPPVRRSSSVTPNHNVYNGSPPQQQQLHTTASNNLLHEQKLSVHMHNSIESLPPPPTYLLDAQQSQSTPTTPPSVMRNSPLKVAETVKTLVAIHHQPASPNAMRRIHSNSQPCQLSPTPQTMLQSFRTSSPGIYAQPKIVSNMSSFRTSSPGPNGHHINQPQATHQLSAPQPKTNPNLIAQLNARLNNKQQQNVSEDIYGSSPNSPNHQQHSAHQQYQQQQSQQQQQNEVIYMRNYQRQQQQQQVPPQPHTQQHYDGNSHTEKQTNKMYGSCSTSHSSSSTSSTPITTNFNASPHFPLSSSTSSLLSKVTSFSALAATSTVTPNSSAAAPTATHYHASQHHPQQIQQQTAAQSKDNSYSNCSQYYATKNAAAALQGNARHIVATAPQPQLSQQQQQAPQMHYHEHYTCPPPLEDPPPPPTANTANYAGTHNISVTMPKNYPRSLGASQSGATGSHLTAYTAASATTTMNKSFSQYQRNRQQQQQKLVHHSYTTPTTYAIQQSVNHQRPPMPLPHDQQQRKQKPAPTSLQQQQHTQNKQPPVPVRHSSVHQQIFVATNPFIQTSATHSHSSSSTHSTPSSPTRSSHSSLASIYGTNRRGDYYHQQQQQQHQYHDDIQQHIIGSSSGNGYNNNSCSTVSAGQNSNYASTKFEKAGSICSKSKAEFLENLNAKLAKQGMSGRAFAVRNLINSKALPDPRICHESLMDQIKRGATLKRNQKINDRSAPKIH